MPARRLACLALGALTLLGSACAHTDRTTTAPYYASSNEARMTHQLLTVEVVDESGISLPAHAFGDARFIEATEGRAYAVRLTNHHHQRVEAVVTVDGRDVVSGELGDYRKQRGYVIPAGQSVVIEGFRQSLDAVAAFRFSSVYSSYSARRGTPEHVGVIGVAVFEERAPRPKKHRPIAVTPYPYYDADTGTYVESAPFPDAPTAADAERAGEGDAFAPAPVPANRVGTAYGESRTSFVTQTKFKRKRKRRPNALLTFHYDSHEGLRERGILPSYYPSHHPTTPYVEPHVQPLEPIPFPHDGFAPPPPR